MTAGRIAAIRARLEALDAALQRAQMTGHDVDDYWRAQSDFGMRVSDDVRWLLARVEALERELAAARGMKDKEA